MIRNNKLIMFITRLFCAIMLLSTNLNGKNEFSYLKKKLKSNVQF